jgi:hypothetical protein
MGQTPTVPVQADGGWKTIDYDRRTSKAPAGKKASETLSVACCTRPELVWMHIIPFVLVTHPGWPSVFTERTLVSYGTHTPRHGWKG